MADKPKQPRAKPLPVATKRRRATSAVKAEPASEGITRDQFFDVLKRIKKAPSRSG